MALLCLGLLAAALIAGSATAVPADEKSFAGALRLAPADNMAAQAAFLEEVIKVSGPCHRAA